MPFQLTTKAVDALLAMCVDRMTKGLMPPAPPAPAADPKAQVAEAISKADMEHIIDSATEAAVDQILEEHRRDIERRIERIDIDDFTNTVAKDALEGIDWERTARDAAEEVVKDQLDLEDLAAPIIEKRLENALAPHAEPCTRHTVATACLLDRVDQLTAARIDGVLASAVDNIVGSVCSRLEERS